MDGSIRSCASEADLRRLLFADETPMLRFSPRRRASFAKEWLQPPEFFVAISCLRNS